MTAVQHTPADTDVVDLPTAIRHLEAAEPGALALHPDGGEVCAIKMTKTGMPWLLDPNGHAGGPTHMTTAMIAQLGYRTEAPAQPKPVDDSPTDVTFAIHIEQLKAAGWTVALLATAANLDKDAARRAFTGKPTLASTRYKILAIDPDHPLTPPSPSQSERVEDLEWLLDSGVAPENAALRCGYGSAKGARDAAAAEGRNDLAVLFGALADSEDEEEADGPTPQDEVLKTVASMGQVTVAALATAMGLSRQGARYHLDILIRRGRLSREVIDGRGTIVYSINEN